MTHYPGTERIVVQPFAVFNIKEDGIWHVERLKVTTASSIMCICYLIFAPLKKFLPVLRTDAVVSANIVKLTCLTFCAADAKNHDSASSQRGLHILCFCDLFLACHESGEGVHKNI